MLKLNLKTLNIIIKISYSLFLVNHKFLLTMMILLLTFDLFFPIPLIPISILELSFNFLLIINKIPKKNLTSILILILLYNNLIFLFPLTNNFSLLKIFICMIKIILQNLLFLFTFLNFGCWIN